jgi:HSP20 family protein
MKLTWQNERKNNLIHQPSWVENSFGLPTVPGDFIQDFFKSTFHNTGISTPDVNVIETNDDFRLEMVAPGMNKEDFSVGLQDKLLTISYEHDDNRAGERRGWKYKTHEYNYHSFTRSFALPETVEVEKIEAKYENGILNLILPKKERAKGKPVREIPVL